MTRRLCIPLATMALLIGSWLAAGSALAAPVAAHQHPSAAGFRPGGRMIGPAGFARPSSHSGRFQEESTNWSGYVGTGGTGAFSSVSASWTQPTATCSSSRRRSSDQYAAFWVGLDGFSSPSVEQTGADSDCRGKNPAYYGWYEMFPAPPVLFGTKLNPGDHMTASVTFRGARTYTLVLRDITRGWTHTIVKNEAGLSRSSIEVITEAPSSVSGVLPLADFGTVRFTGAKANGTLLRKLAPIRIIMIDGSGRDKALTSLIGSADAFTNTWVRSN